MKRIFTVLFLVFLSMTAFSQRVYFIYLQTDNDQPFFVRMNEKTYSSSASGYLILSKLRDSSYHFKLGFPQGKWPEQQFTVDVKGKDRGFVLKNFNEKGWGLFDLQTLAVQMAEEGPKRMADTSGRGVSAFTDVLSKAANDPSLKDRTIPVRQTETPPAVINAVVKEEVPVTKNMEDKVMEKRDTAKMLVDKAAAEVVEKAKTPVQEMPKAEIKKDTILSQEPLVNKEKEKEKEKVVKQNDSIETATAAKDTAMAAPLLVKEEPKKEEIVKREPLKEEPKQVLVKEEAEKEKEKETEKLVVETPKVETPKLELPKYDKSKVVKRSESSTSEGLGLTYVDTYTDGKRDTIRIMIPNPKETIPSASSQAKDSPAIGSRIVKPIPTKTCSSVATEADFLKLRKNMAAQGKDEAMINEAKKSFKAKCYMAEQVRNLGSLFLNEAGKYLFFEAAYPTVVDNDAFKGLLAEFKDPYFVHRFKNLTGL